jgi:hypothetical protein
VPSPRTRAALALPAAALLALALSGCGDDGGISQTTVPNSFVPPSMLSPNEEAPSNDTIPPPTSLGDPDPPGQSPTDPDGPGDVDQGGEEGDDSPSSTVQSGQASER